MKPYSQMVPRTRKERLIAYNRRIHEAEESITVLREWNLDLDRRLVEFEGRKLKQEILLFKENKEHRYVLRSSKYRMLQYYLKFM